MAHPSRRASIRSSSRGRGRTRYLAESLEPRVLLATIMPEPTGGIPLLPGHQVAFRKTNPGSFTITNLAAADKLFSVPFNDPLVGADAFDNGVPVINYLDSGPGLFFANPRDVGSSTLHVTYGGFFDHAEDDNFAMKSSGYLYLPVAGNYTFEVRSNDGERLVMGANNLTVLQADVTRAFPFTDTAQVQAPSAGYYHYQLTWFQSTGGAMCEFFAHGDGQPAELLVGDPNGQIKVYQNYDEPVSIQGVHQTLPEDGVLSIQIPMANISDPDPASLRDPYKATVDWGDGTPIDNNVQVIGESSDSIQLFGGHTYKDEGDFTLAITIADPDGPTSVGHATWTITEADGFFPFGTSFFFNPGQAFSGQVASFSLPAAPLSDLAATINWGDGTPQTAGVLSLGASVGGLAVSGTHAFVGSGPFNVTATITDDGSGTATGTAHSTATGEKITGSAAGFARVEGQSFSGGVATFTDNNPARLPGDFVATIDWGDGTSTGGQVTGSNGNFSVAGAHTYADEGAFPFKVTLGVNTPGGASGTAAATANLSENDSLTVKPMSFRVVAGQPFSGTVATFTDANPAQLASDFSGTIDWGDGTTTAATITTANGTFTVTGAHTYSAVGFGGFLLTITISDDSPGTATTTVHDSAIGEQLFLFATPVTATEAAPFSGTVATFMDNFTDRPAGDFAATIDWGDGTSTAGTVTGANGNFTITGSHTYIDEGPFNTSVKLSVNKPGGPSTNFGNVATVAEADVLTATGTDVSATQRQPFSGTVATFTDTNAQNVAGDFAATINWGDGSTTPGGIAGGNGSFTVFGKHTYQSSGRSKLVITITDEAPGTAGAAVSAIATITASLPAVTALSFLYDQSPPGVSFTFNEDVSIGSSALTVVNLATGASVPVASMQYLAERHTATFRFAGVLPNGSYQATLAASAITDTNGNHPVSDPFFYFFSLQGDINRDRTVSFADLLILAQNYGATSASLAQGDLNADGSVGFDDLLLLAQNYGASVPSPPAAAPLAAALDPTRHRRG